MSFHRSDRVLAALLVLVACDPGPTSDKGGEELELTGGKADSFFNPTMHGPLGFELTNRATFSDAGTFHAWTFELDADATFTLRSQLGGNLDSVMYLYFRDDASDSWGPFIEKNDDFEGQLFSQITFDGGPGEYRVLLKPFKQAMRGDFSVLGTCEGEGCPDSGTPTCDPGETLPFPTTGTLNETCAARFVEVLASEVEFMSETEVDHALKCDLDGLALEGVQIYESFWGEFVGSLQDTFGLSDDESLRLNLSLNSHDEGDTVNIDAGGDEDGMSIVFADGAPLMLYQHNQSPTVEWFCADDGSPAVPLPSEDCMSDALFGLPHGDEVLGDEGSASAEEALDSIDPAIAFAVARFAETHALAESEEVGFSALIWESLDFDRGAEITVSHDGASATYHLIEGSFSGVSVISERDENGFRFVCE